MAETQLAVAGAEHRLALEHLPTYDVSDAVATVVEADLGTTWEAIVNADLIEVGRRRPLIGMLGAIRILPELAAHLMHGERPPEVPETMTLRQTTEQPIRNGGWVLLGERPEQEIALGLVGKFWRPVIEFADVSAEEFRDFAEPGFAKTVYSLEVSPLEGGRTLLSGLMRVATTDEHARRWFRRYWNFGVGPGAHVLVQGLLESAREDAEGKG